MCFRFEDQPACHRLQTACLKARRPLPRPGTAVTGPISTKITRHIAAPAPIYQQIHVCCAQRCQYQPCGPLLTHVPSLEGTITRAADHIAQSYCKKHELGMTSFARVAWERTRGLGSSTSQYWKAVAKRLRPMVGGLLISATLLFVPFALVVSRFMLVSEKEWQEHQQRAKANRHLKGWAKLRAVYRLAVNWC